MRIQSQWNSCAFERLAMLIKNLVSKSGTRRNSISPDAWVLTAIRKFRAKNATHLIVSRDGQIIDGIICEHDVIEAIGQYGSRAHRLLVSDIMTDDVTTCRASDDTNHVLIKMLSLKLNPMPVINSKGHFAGFVSMEDIVCQDPDFLPNPESLASVSHLQRIA